MKETDIQAAIITYLGVLENQGKIWFSRLNNIPPVIKDNNGKVSGFRRLPRGCKKGIPDILIITKGRTIAMEVKTPKGKQSPEQKVVEDSFKKQGKEYHVVRSLEDAIKVLGYKLA